MISFLILDFGFKKRGTTVLVIPLDPIRLSRAGLKNSLKGSMTPRLLGCGLLGFFEQMIPR